MNILGLIALMAQEDKCPSGTATLDSISKDSDVFNACPQGWQVGWSVHITGTLKPDQEYYWEEATNAAGDNWSFKSRGVTTSVTSVGTVGSSGPGGVETQYRKVRCYIVPVGEAVANACAGPVTSAQASRTGPLCTL